MRLIRHMAVVAMGASSLVIALPPATAEPFGSDVIASPDTEGTVGTDTSIALDADGNPVISYQDAENGDLKVLHCTNADCTGTQTPISVDTAGDVGRDSSLALDADGNPVISYLDAGNGDLKVLHCSNPGCTGTQLVNTPDSADSVGSHTSLVLDADGNPVIAYYDQTNADLKVLHCTNPACSGVQTPASPDTEGVVGGFTDIVLDADGNPVVSYWDGGNADLKVLHCTNPGCTGTQTAASPDTAGDVGMDTSLALDAAGNPVVSYRDNANGNLKVLHCTNPGCTGTQTSSSPDGPDNVGGYTSLALDTVGNPVISYRDVANGNVKVLHCTNPGCTGTQTPSSPDTEGEVGAFTSLALDEVGNPVVAYYDFTNSALKVLHCYDVAGCGGRDQDVDGVTHTADNCPTTANPDQADQDDDGLGNACDDTDGRIPAACAAFVGANVIVGEGNVTVLTGTSGPDVILGQGLDETIDGRGGNDCIVAGGGQDSVKGGRGADLLIGGRGADTLVGGRGTDEASGGRGRDTCTAETESSCER